MTDFPPLFYAAIRSLYRQKRNDEIRNGKPTAVPSLGISPGGADLPMEDEDAAPPPSAAAPAPITATPASFTAPAR